MWAWSIWEPEPRILYTDWKAATLYVRLCARECIQSIVDIDEDCDVWLNQVVSITENTLCGLLLGNDICKWDSFPKKFIHRVKVLESEKLHTILFCLLIDRKQYSNDPSFVEKHQQCVGPLETLPPSLEPIVQALKNSKKIGYHVYINGKREFIDTKLFKSRYKHEDWILKEQGFLSIKSLDLKEWKTTPSPAPAYSFFGRPLRLKDCVAKGPFEMTDNKVKRFLICTLYFLSLYSVICAILNLCFVFFEFVLCNLSYS